MKVMAASFDAAAYTSDAKRNWTEASEHYDKISLEVFPPITEAFLSFVQLRPGQLVLDVACGTGAVTAAAARSVGAAGRVVGVDLSPGMLKIAMGRAQERNLEYREMDAESLDMPDGLFNVVLCQLGLMLFPRPEAALKEMVRVCKKGGSVACVVQGDPERMAFTGLIMKTLFQHAPELKQPGAPGIYAFAPVGVLDQALARAGLGHILSSRVSGTFAFPSPRDYWETMTRGGGRTGALLRSLPQKTQEAIEAEVLSKAALYAVPEGGVRVPFEVVMAKGVKP